MMKKRIFSSVFLASLLLPLAAFAELNGPQATARATLPGTLSVTGTQTIAAVGGCSRVTVNITGDIQGTTDDGAGNDTVSFQLWDDGELKDSLVLDIPVDTARASLTQTVDVTLSFEGLYGQGVEGVGVLVVDEPGGTLLYVNDPFIPVDVTGSCGDLLPQSVPVFGLPALLATSGLLALLGLGFFSGAGRRRK